MTDKRPGALARGSIFGVGLLLALALYGLVNYLSLRHFDRFDWTESRIYTLSERSERVIEGLDEDVEAVIFMNPGDELYPAVDELLSRYEAANPSRFTKRTIDPARNMLEARQLVEEHDLQNRANVVVLATADDRRVIESYEMADYDYSGAQYGQPPSMKAFKGEQMVTSAVLELVESEKPRLVFVAGHGEATLDRMGQVSLSQARTLLGEDNFEIEEWSSTGAADLPEGTDLVVVAGPQRAFLDSELALFDRYLDAGGRMLFLLDPVFTQGGRMVEVGLGEWLARYGVDVGPDIVIDPAGQLPFFGPETLSASSYGSHPIVDSLGGTSTPVLFSLARSVSAGEAPGGVEVTELVRTGDAAWGETDLDSLDRITQDDHDLAGPVALGVAVSFPAGSGPEPWTATEAAPSPLGIGLDVDVADAGSADDETTDDEEATAAADEPLADEPVEDEPLADEPVEETAATDDDETTPVEARLVVFGDLDFAADSQLASFGNVDLFLNTFNWLVQREQLISIEPREPEQTRLDLTGRELWNLYILVLVVLPGMAILAGIWVFLRRRR